MKKVVMLAALVLGLSAIGNAEIIPAKKVNAKEVTTVTPRKRKAKKVRKARRVENAKTESTAKK